MEITIIKFSGSDPHKNQNQKGAGKMDEQVKRYWTPSLGT